MIVFPNAKINLGLDILSRRPDGYHEISTVMVPVGWHDVLEVVPSRGGKTTLTVNGNTVDCPAEKNLVMKAYRALDEVTRPLPPVDIYLRKIIPDGAGLGGGSADAAFTIKALNALFSLGLTNSCHRYRHRFSARGSSLRNLPHEARHRQTARWRLHCPRVCRCHSRPPRC